MIRTKFISCYALIALLLSLDNCFCSNITLWKLTPNQVKAIDILHHEPTDTVIGQFTDKHFVSCEVYQFSLNQSSVEPLISDTLYVYMGAACDSVHLYWNMTVSTILSWNLFRGTNVAITNLNLEAVEQIVITETENFESDIYFGLAWIDNKLLRWDPQTRSIVWNRATVGGSSVIQRAYLSISVNTVFVLVKDGAQKEKIAAVNYDTGGWKQDPPKSKICPTGWHTSNLLWDKTQQIFVCAEINSNKAMVQLLIDDGPPVFWNGTGTLQDSLFTERFLVLLVKKPSQYCYIFLKLDLKEISKKCLPEQVGSDSVPFLGSWTVSEKGHKLYAAWYFPDIFELFNIAYTSGTYILEIEFEINDYSAGSSTLSAYLTIVPPPSKSAFSGDDKETIIILVSSVIVFSAIIILVAILCMRHHRSKKAKYAKELETHMTVQTTSTVSTLFHTNIPLSVPGYLEISETSFRKAKLIAQGGIGSIFLVDLMDCQLRDRVQASTAVVKCTMTDSGSGILKSTYRELFLQEVALLHYLNNQSQYFAKLYGFTTSNLTLMLKFYERGSLKSFIANSTTWTKRMVMNFSLDISRGLSVMHRLGFAHCDIKADNVLIDMNEEEKRFWCVLTDLGISRIVSDRTLGVHRFKPKAVFGMSLQYAAPEILDVHILSKKDERTSEEVMSGDVYAFAVVLYQLVNRLPVPQFSKDFSAK